MRKISTQQTIKIYDYDELTPSDRQLIDAAKEASTRSYAPYSNFYVGAAVRLDDNTIITGNNQENSAYPSGICAERTTIFYANSLHPNKAVTTISIAARTQHAFLKAPISPCGACRQVLLESEKRFNTPIRMLLYGTDCIYEIENASSLLPLQFTSESMVL